VSDTLEVSDTKMVQQYCPYEFPFGGSRNEIEN